MRKQKGNAEVKDDGELENALDALFKLPLAEFTNARNVLAARLKKSGQGNEANRVKALAKPSISAWAVNQLYWNHRAAFDQLIASGERFHKAQSSRLAGKLADMRTALDARREALTQLSDLAASLLQEAGHNPAPDTIHRITTTLEAMSASRSDAPRPGCLTHDVDPPGFESLAAFTPAAGKPKRKDDPTRFTAAPKSTSAVTNTRRKIGADDNREPRKTKIAAAKVSLQDAKRSLNEARVRAQRLEAARKHADAEAKKAEESLKKAKGAAEEAARRARSAALEVAEAAKSLKDAERTVEKASNELESLFRESSGS